MGLKFLEHDLEDIIYKMSQTQKGRAKLAERGGPIIHNPLYRQVHIGDYGRCDLLDISYDPWSLHLHIFELKRRKITNESIKQAFTYLKGLQHYLDETPKFIKLNIYPKIILIGKSLNVDSTILQLLELSEIDVEIYTYSYSLKGLHFVEQHFHNKHYFRRYSPHNKQLKTIIEQPLTKYLKGAEKYYEKEFLTHFENNEVIG